MLHPTLTLRWGCLIAECPEEVNLALILWPVVACIVLIPLLLLCIFIFIRNRRDAAEFARFMKEKDKARWESVSTLLKVFLLGFCSLGVFRLSFCSLDFFLSSGLLFFSCCFSLSSGLSFFGVFFCFFWGFVLWVFPFVLGFCSLFLYPFFWAFVLWVPPHPPHTPLFLLGPLIFGGVFFLSSWLLFFGFFPFLLGFCSLDFSKSFWAFLLCFFFFSSVFYFILIFFSVVCITGEKQRICCWCCQEEVTSVGSFSFHCLVSQTENIQLSSGRTFHHVLSMAW